MGDVSDQIIEVGFAPSLSNEQDVRREVMLALLKTGGVNHRIEKTADQIVEYILEGPKTKGSRYGRLPVWFPGNDRNQPPEARASVTEDGYLLIEFRDEDLRTELLALIKNNDPVEVIELSFGYKPVTLTNNDKDI